MKSIDNFLLFDGKRISMQLEDGQWWIALKPICQVLKVDYIRQFKNLKSDENYNELLSEQTMVGADGKLRKMVCLPERYTYGWIMSLRSEDPGLKNFKRECHDVLFNHFRGKLTERVLRLTEKNEALEKINECKSRLLESPEYKEILISQKKIKHIEKSLRMLDKDLITGQISFEL